MDKTSVARFTLLIVAVINAVLNMIGLETIPEEFVNNVIAVISGGYIIYAAWKDNDITKKAVLRKQKIKELEEQEKQDLLNEKY